MLRGEPTCSRHSRSSFASTTSHHEAATSHNVDYATADRKAAESQVEEALAQKRIAEPVDLKIADAAAHVNQLQGEVKRAQADLEQANLNIGWCDIRAPQTDG